MLTISIVGITIFMCVFLVVVIGICLLCNWKKTPVESGVFVGLTILSALIAFVTALSTRVSLGQKLAQELLPLLGERADALFQSSTSALEGVEMLGALMVAPVMFLVVFLLALLVLYLAVGLPLHLTVFRRMRKEKEPSLAPGLAIGAVQGLLIALLILAPVCSLLSLCGHAMGAYVDVVDAAEVDEPIGDISIKDLDTYADQLQKNGLIQAVDTTMGGLICHPLTHGETKTFGDLDLKDELCAVMRCMGYISLLTDDTYAKNAEGGKNAILTNLYEAIFTSKWLPAVSAEAVGDIANSWKKGEAYMGLSMPTMDPVFKPLMTQFLEIMSVEDTELFRTDMKTFIQVYTLMQDNGLLEEGHSMQDLMQKLGEERLYTQMMDSLKANEHLAPLVTEMETVSLRMVAQVLDVTRLESGEYDQKLDEMATKLSSVLTSPPEEREEIVCDAVKNALVTYDIDVPDDVAVSVAEKVIEELGADGEISGDEIREYLVEHADEDYGHFLDDKDLNNLLP